MPTGYTSDIYDGKIVNGKDFILQCARAFGACIMMREDSLDKPIPEEFQPNTYHKEELENAKKNLQEIFDLSDEEIQTRIKSEFNERIERDKKCRKENKALENRYNKALAEVLEWQPPTDDHKELKKFAIDQLKESIKYDCSYYKMYEPDFTKPTITEWRELRITTCMNDINYHSQKWDEEVKRTAERNQWIKDLRESLK